MVGEIDCGAANRPFPLAKVKALLKSHVQAQVRRITKAVRRSDELLLLVDGTKREARMVLEEITE